jgi:hypothetical protein
MLRPAELQVVASVARYVYFTQCWDSEPNFGYEEGCAGCLPLKET